MHDDLRARATEIARDHDRGAAELLSRLLPLLADALKAPGTPVIAVARIVLAAQPAMAPLWHACAAAVDDVERPGAFARTRAELERAPRALTRAAAAALADLLRDARAPRLLTLSYSSTIAHVLEALAATTVAHVTCGEGRPRFEGRRLAVDLQKVGLPVTLMCDAALTASLDQADAVVLGADAVGPRLWVNKVGSFGLTAAAGLCGVPVYVIAGRSKLVPATFHLTLPRGPNTEIWADSPSGLQLDNPYFERIPSDIVTLFLMEGGPAGPGDLRPLTEGLDERFSKLLRYMSVKDS